MNIGILTLPLHTNYGGILQVFALGRALEIMGHRPVILDRQSNHRPDFVTALAILKRVLLAGIRKPPGGEVFSEFRTKIERPILMLCVKSFIDRYLPHRTVALRSSTELRNAIHEHRLDAIVVGSDQVWRPEYTPNIADYFLDFAKDDAILRLSYAASFGTDRWLFSWRQTQRFGKLLRRFDGVSVRESSAVNLCAGRFGVNAEHVVDPVLLLDQDDYRAILVDHPNPYRNDTLMTYVLDRSPDKSALIDDVRTATGLSVACADPKSERLDLPIEDRIASSVESWLNELIHAKFIVTDSFHATVIAILFNVPFLVYVNKQRGATRFESLLDAVRLRRRIVTSASELDPEVARQPIDWEPINDLVEQRRQYSREFLMRYLG